MTWLCDYFNQRTPCSVILSVNPKSVVSNSSTVSIWNVSLPNVHTVNVFYSNSSGGRELPFEWCASVFPSGPRNNCVQWLSQSLSLACCKVEKRRLGDRREFARIRRKQLRLEPTASNLGSHGFTIVGLSPERKTQILQLSVQCERLKHTPIPKPQLKSTLHSWSWVIKFLSPAIGFWLRLL